MKIEQSSVALDATHDYVYESRAEVVSGFRAVFSEVSEAGAAESANSGEDARMRLAILLQHLIARMLELISGKGESRAANLDEFLQNSSPASTAGADGGGRRMRMEWTTEITEILHEHESTGFSACGKVSTADGRTIDFSLQLAMCRDYSCERTLRQSGSLELHDPLLINFDGNAAQLAGRRFAFDLDADGAEEMIPGLAAGSAWLAFDRNGDGRINDGSELFGTRFGDGFADLAALDADGNHWIDEADPAFASLCLWRRDDDGTDTLRSLRDGGIGAIYLGSTQTPFALTDADNARQGYVRASGVYLREDGGVGAVQQVDLAV